MSPRRQLTIRTKKPRATVMTTISWHEDMPIDHVHDVVIEHQDEVRLAVVEKQIEEEGR